MVTGSRGAGEQGDKEDKEDKEEKEELLNNVSSLFTPSSLSRYSLSSSLFPMP
jgi:hypothetical protein